MLFKPLAFAATAAAFVIAPEISEADEDIFKALPIHAETFALPPSALSQSLSVPCAQCKGRDSHLRLDFDVADGSKLMLNGFELYPHADPWNGDLTAILVKGDGKEKEQRLGYSLSIEPAAMDQDQQMQLIDVELRVIEVGSRFVEGVPAIQVQLVKAATDDIVIGNVVLEDADGMECGSMWCKAKGLAAEVFKAIKSFKGKGCGRNRHHMGHPQGHTDAGVVPLHGGRPDHETMEPHHHDWHKLLKNIASYIFLPILMGITAGVGVAVYASVPLTQVSESTLTLSQFCHAPLQRRISRDSVRQMQARSGRPLLPQEAAIAPASNRCRKGRSDGGESRGAPTPVSRRRVQGLAEVETPGQVDGRVVILAYGGTEWRSCGSEQYRKIP